MRIAVACVALLVGCSVGTSEVQSADTVVFDDSDDDYSSFFLGITDEEVIEFELQDDADHIAHPETEVEEPEHETAAPSVARTTRGGSVTRAGTIGTLAPAAGSGSGDGGGGTCVPSATVSASASVPFAFNLSVPAQYVGTYGPVRQHNIYLGADISGAGNLALSGSLTATPTSWSATISVAANINLTVVAHAFQQLVGPLRTQWFSIGDATLSAGAGFSDSVTFSQNCNGQGVLVTTPGTQAITANLNVDDLTLYGYFFPRLQGPIVTRVRGAIAQFLRNLANRHIPGMIQPYVFQLNQQYQAKKMELLNTLIGKLPPNCGCAIVQAVVGAGSSAP
jgi:hypothetical protein